MRRFIRSITVLMLAWLACTVADAAQVDGERAMQLIRQQCDFGPRIPNSEAHRKCAEWIKARLGELKLHVVDQKYTADLALINTTAPSDNYYGLPAADGPTSGAIMLTAHWDTRPFADRDESGTQPPMLGANDGASGVALGLEIVRAMQGTPVAKHLVLLFQDAEDSGVYDNENSWGIGAQYAAAHPPAWIKRVKFGINLDMVAGENIPYVRDAASMHIAPRQTDALWQLGHTLAPTYFSDGTPQQVMDDHIAWVNEGVPFINLLGLPWHHWHTGGDKPENCSAVAMQALGDVLVEYLTEQTK